MKDNRFSKKRPDDDHHHVNDDNSKKMIKYCTLYQQAESKVEKLERENASLKGLIFELLNTLKEVTKIIINGERVQKDSFTSFMNIFQGPVEQSINSVERIEK